MNTIDSGLLTRGMIIGFSIAAPIGPIGVLCIRRTLAGGPVSGLVSGLGAATADAIHGAVAAFALTLVAPTLASVQGWLRPMAGMVLCCLGAKILRARPANRPVEAPRFGLLRAYASTFLLTMTNPITILAFGAVFAGFGLAEGRPTLSAPVTLVAGIFAGSALWWMLLSGGVGLLRHRLTPRTMQWVNRGSGLIIVGFGLLALAGAG